MWMVKYFKKLFYRPYLAKLFILFIDFNINMCKHNLYRQHNILNVCNQIYMIILILFFTVSVRIVFFL